MSDKKISQLTGASTPLTGAEILPVVQGGQTVKATAQDVADLAGGGGSYLYIGNSSGVSSIDWANATVQELNLDSNPTLTFSNGILGTTSTLLLKQVQAGQKTVTWPNNVKWSGNSAPLLNAVPGPGKIDSTFDIGSAFDGIVNVIKVQPDGKILVGGAFNNYKGVFSQCLVRLNPDGSKDSSFSTQTWYSLSGTPEIFAIEILPDGSILVGGNIGGQFSFMGKKWLQKVNADGTWDGSFDAALNGIVRAIKRQSDGKIVIGGQFGTIGGNNSQYIGRIGSDGTYDNTFVSFASGHVYAIEIQTDGKVLIGGVFSSVNPMGSTVNAYGIARLLTNGAYDVSFDTGTKLLYNSMGSPGWVYAIALQPDGKVLVGGYFTVYNGTNVNHVIRLNSDASLDTSFSTSLGPTDTIRSLSITSNNKLLIGGNFTSYYKIPSVSSTCNRIALVSLIDNSFDNDFASGVGSGANAQVYATAVQADGKFLIGGAFTTIDSTSSNYITRLNSQASGDPYYNRVTFDYNGVDYIGSF